jgi:hypothetical protein
MNSALVSMAVILVVCLVVTGVVAVKNERLRAKLVGVGLGIAGALAAVVALLTLGREKKRAKEVATSTKQVKDGRGDAVEDAKSTESAINDEVSSEVDTHKDALEEQEALESAKRERLKA